MVNGMIFCSCHGCQEKHIHTIITELPERKRKKKKRVDVRWIYIRYYKSTRHLSRGWDKDPIMTGMERNLKTERVQSIQRTMELQKAGVSVPDSNTTTSTTEKRNPTDYPRETCKVQVIFPKDD